MIYPRALWARINKNPDVSTGPLARPFARPLAPLTRLLDPHNSLYSRAPLCSLIHSLAHFAHFTHSLARGTVNDLIAIFSVFFFDLAISVAIFVRCVLASL